MPIIMNPCGDRVRAGFSKSGALHVEVWPVSFGWRRGVDPAVSSCDPQEIVFPADCLPAMSKIFAFKMPNNFQRGWLPVQSADTNSDNRFLVSDELGANFAVTYFDGDNWRAAGTDNDLGVEAALDFEPIWQVFLDAVLNKFPPIVLD